MVPGVKYGSRLPNFDISALLAQPNPSVDLKLDAHHNKTSEFLKAVTDYTTRATTEISSRREAYLAEKKRIAEKVQETEQETSQYKLTELELLATIEREKEETKQAEAVVQSRRREHASVRDASASADAEIAQYRAVVESLRRERAAERAALDAQAKETETELSELESALGLTLEGIGSDQLLVRFYNMTQDCTLVLDLSSQIYRVLTMSPSLPTLPILLDELNESRDIFEFLKSVRKEFRSVLHSS